MLFYFIHIIQCSVGIDLPAIAAAVTVNEENHYDNTLQH